MTDLKPGRELDALIAEKVMIGVNKFEALFVNSIDKHSGTVTTRTELVYPPYSTDIAAAWTVVEVLRTKFPSHRFNLLITNDEAQGPGIRYGVHLVNYLGMGDFDDLASTVADTAPHAICLAALKAVGEEIK